MLIFRLISLLSYSLSLVFGQDICVDQILDAAVFSEDNSTCFVFRGEYFWTAHSLTGIIDREGVLIQDFWKGLPAPIDAAFRIEESTHQKSTVFVVDGNWYQYRDGNQIDRGPIKEWIYYPRTPITSAFTQFRSDRSSDFHIYVLFNNNTEYTSYLFGEVRNPSYKEHGETFISKGWLDFIYKHPGMRFTDKLSNLIQVTAAMSNQDHIWFFGIREYCITDSPPKPLKCNLRPLYKWLGCQPYVQHTTSTSDRKTDPGDFPESPNSKYPKHPNNNSEVFWILLFFAVFGITAIVICMIVAVLVRKRSSHHKSRITKRSKTNEVIRDSKETIESMDNYKGNAEKTSEPINKEQVVEADQLMAEMRSDNNDI